ncbi:hypothetical protein QDR37_15670 [Amnibacterium sp. CER49]|uniref:hypothetical protein n=1 Tax=Amnibacterium sp. CER49 TaxID=3039161 RepID=UPI0024488EDD|nr:hypothetical protein [Amnibacterium sp. CER49]MDH2445386.1 hypothetical protein [Amnibacterium sp. CER49]
MAARPPEPPPVEAAPPPAATARRTDEALAAIPLGLRVAGAWSWRSLAVIDLPEEPDDPRDRRRRNDDPRPEDVKTVA